MYLSRVVCLGIMLNNDPGFLSFGSTYVLLIKLLKCPFNEVVSYKFMSSTCITNFLKFIKHIIDLGDILRRINTYNLTHIVNTYKII